eukprot:6587254-Prymnesium_polylepis.1
MSSGVISSCVSAWSVEDMNIVVPFVKSADNDADFFTKPLAPNVFFAMRNRIMNHDVRTEALAAAAVPALVAALSRDAPPPEVVWRLGA